MFTIEIQDGRRHESLVYEETMYEESTLIKIIIQVYIQ